MSTLYRLVYASQSNALKEGAIDPVVGSILMQSRRNNTRLGIGGVLFYGDGFFFQCLEGEKDVVEATYQKICLDSRHRFPTVLKQGPVSSRLFEDWSMKFVPAEKEVREFLRQQDMPVFNPFRFSERMVDELVMFFHQLRMPMNFELPGVREEPVERPATTAQPAASTPNNSLFKRVLSGLGLRKSA